MSGTTGGLIVTLASAPPSPRRPAASARNGTAPTPAAASRAARPWPWRSRPRARPPPCGRTRRPARRHCRWRPAPVRLARLPRRSPPPARNRRRAAPPWRRCRPAPPAASRGRGCARAAPHRRASANRPRPARRIRRPNGRRRICASRARSTPASVSSTRIAASDTATSAGCAFSVSVIASAGPSHITARELVAERLVDLVEHPPRDREGLRERLAHADSLAALPRKHVRRRHLLTPQNFGPKTPAKPPLSSDDQAPVTKRQPSLVTKPTP